MKRHTPAFLCVLLLAFQTLSAQTQGQWTTTATMQIEREYHAQVRLLTGSVLSVGGIDNASNYLTSAELFNPAGKGSWTLTGSMSAARAGFAAVVLSSGKVLAVAGLSTGGSILGDAEIYDPVSGTWSPAGSLSVPRYDHTATLLTNGKVLVAGGCTSSGCGAYTAVSELYDPTTNSWSTTGSLNSARAIHTAVRLNGGKVLAIGGLGASTSAELYSPATGKWTTAASPAIAQYLNTVTLLPNGKVLATGGEPSRGPNSSAELYDPLANTWTLTGSMTDYRYGHTATLLPDNTVLIAGGIGQSISCGKACTGYIPTSRAEIYNIATGTFTAIPPLSRALAFHSATSLKTGRALINGGEGTTAYCCTIVNTAEYYVPLTLTFSSASLNFGLLQTGLTSTAQTVTVTNASPHSAAFTGITASGDYAQTNTCPATLTSGLSCTISITFSPTATGTRNGAVTLKDNSPGSPSQTIGLTGIGEALSLGFSPGSLAFPTIPATTSTYLSATLVNDGSGPVNLTGFSIAPSGTFLETGNCPTTLAVQQSCTIQVTFAPPDVGTYKATLTVSNGAGAAATLPLTGTASDAP